MSYRGGLHLPGSTRVTKGMEKAGGDYPLSKSGGGGFTVSSPGWHGRTPREQKDLRVKMGEEHLTPPTGGEKTKKLLFGSKKKKKGQ